MNDLTVNLKKTIHAPIERVFDAWLDPALLARFMIPMAGMPNPDTQTDPRVGGAFTIIMHAGDNDLPHSGVYKELKRPHRLVFTWVSAHSTDDSEVQLDFSAVDENTTEIKLTHIRFLNEEARSNHEGGWGNILVLLEEIL